MCMKWHSYANRHSFNAAHIISFHQFFFLLFLFVEIYVSVCLFISLIHSLYHYYYIYYFFSIQVSMFTFSDFIRISNNRKSTNSESWAISFTCRVVEPKIKINRKKEKKPANLLPR